MDEYNDIINEFFQKRPQKQNDLSGIKTLLKQMGNPHLSYPVIHVAGTNGKGQVSSKTAHAFQAAGYKTGLFTSPHIFTYEERIVVNGVLIPKEKIAQYYRELQEIARSFPFKINFFEWTTCFAFRYFSEQKVDIAVIEVGLGGTYDSTNVVEPLISVITSISLDHTDYLGETLEEIAKEKAGIIKPHIPVVVGPHAQFAPILQRAELLKAPLYKVEEKAPFYEVENQAVVKQVLSIASNQFSLSSQAVETGLKYRLPGRFDVRGNTIFDVAHNPDGFARLNKALSYFYPEQKFRFVIGMSQTKDVLGSLNQIHQKATHIHFVQAKEKGGKSPADLAKELQKLSSCHFSLEPSVAEGVKNAQAALKGKEMLVVCGSFYIMAEAMSSVS